ncbi:Type VI secretion system-associated [Candidatus Magnetomorum sp. HK-1]|nr:Type VI secretion system-associated [Candidatus Magnetomorum sp. HK-1]
MDFEKIINTCLKPISKDSPAGNDCKNMDIYPPFQTEISKIFNPSREKINWEKMRDEAISLLSTTSKDIEIALYLTIALFRLNGYNGYLAGLRIFVGIIEAFPETYFPRSNNEKTTAKSRRIVINNLNKRSLQYMAPNPAKSEDTQTIHQIWEQLKKFQEIIKKLEEMFNTFSVSLPTIDELVNRIEEFKTDFPMKVTEEKDKNPEIENHDIQPPTKEAVPQKEYKSESKSLPPQMKASPNAFDKVLVSTANALRLENPFNPVSYRIKRMALWDSKKELPPVNEGKTLMPFTQSMKNLQKTWQKPESANSNMIEEMEKQFDNMLWWLDLQYAIVKMMTQVGPEYKPAVRAITHELKYLLKRFPDLPIIAFNKGEAFANPKTRIWLETLTTESESTFDFPSYLIDEKLKDDINEAETLARDDKLTEALTFIQEGFRTAVGVKDIFCRKLAAARLCLENQRVNESQIIFDYLFQQSKAFHLSQWDPLLFLELCQWYDKAIKSNPEKISIERKNEIDSEILKLNVSYNI